MRKKNLDIESVLADVLIKKCFGYDTDKYVDTLEGIGEFKLSSTDKKVLNHTLSCLGIGTSIRFLRMKYHERAHSLIKRITETIYELFLSDSNEETASIVINQIEKYSRLFEMDYVGIYDFEIGIVENILEPVYDDLSESIKPSDPRLSLWFNIFITDVGHMTKVIVDNAERKYKYNPQR